ncbi:unnamed protein product, partial [Meganyctiphanes norvegica]
MVTKAEGVTMTCCVLLQHREGDGMIPQNSFGEVSPTVSKFSNEDVDPHEDIENDSSAEDIPDEIVSVTPLEAEGSTVTASGTSRAVGSSSSRSNFFTDSQMNTPLQDERGQLNLLSAAYESLDYDTCMNSVLLDEERTKGYTFVIKKDMMRWLVVFFVGTFTALVACGIDITIESLSKFKYSLLSSYTNKCALDNCLAIPFFLWGALNIGPTLVAAFLGSYVEVMYGVNNVGKVKSIMFHLKLPKINSLKQSIFFCIQIQLVFDFILTSYLRGLHMGSTGP